jgi:hypothetical protein
MDGRTTRILVWIAFGVPLFMDAVYVGLIKGQGAMPPERYTIAFVSAYLLLMAGLLAASLTPNAPRVVRASLRSGAAAGMIVLGVLAAFSIGLPLLLVGLVAMVTAIRTITGPGWRKSSASSTVTAVLSVALLIAGFEVTERMIACPAHGNMSGSGTGFVSGQYHYDCVNGRLDWHSGQ